MKLFCDTKERVDNSSGCAGVYWDKNSRRWIAIITYSRATISLGSYKLFDDAVAVRKSAQTTFDLITRLKGN